MSEDADRERHPSVVIPTHHRTRLLRRALESVTMQTLQPLEVVVVDDVKDNATRAAVREVSERCGLSVRYIGYRGGGGVSASRNLGVRAAHGALVALLDDDDYWAPTYLARAVRRLYDTDADAVVTWRADGIEGSLRTYRNPPEGLTAHRVVAANPGVVGSNIVLRRDVFERMGGFDESLAVSNDVDFFVRFLEGHHRYAVVPEPLVLVGNVPGPRLTDADQRRIEGMRRYLAKHAHRMTAVQRIDYRRRVRRATMRMRRDAASGRWRRVLYTAGVLALSRPEGRKDVQRVMALLRST